MSAVKKDCARSLYNAYVVLSHPERSGLDKKTFWVDASDGEDRKE